MPKTKRFRFLALAAAVWMPLGWGAAGCQSGDPDLREAPVAGVQDPDLTDAQVWVLVARDPAAPADLRRRALELLAQAERGGDAARVRLYRAVLADRATDDTVVATCALALVRHGGPKDAGAVAGLLKRDTAYTRWVAAVSLQRLHDPAVVGPLVEALDDPDADVRAAAAAALGQYPRRDVYDALVQALEDVDYGVTRSAQHSLTALTGHDGDDDPRAWLDYAKQAGAGLLANPRPYVYERYDGPGGWAGRVRRLLGTPDALVEARPVGLDGAGE